MKKIPTLFQRDASRRYVTDEVTPGCEWVLAGEGRATRKWDGTCVLIDAGGIYTRREVKPGKEAPNEFVPIDHDEVTGKTMGWEPYQQSTYVKYLTEALEALRPITQLGTYELVGPKINGNPEQFETHTLVRHGEWEIFAAPRTYEGLREWFTDPTFLFEGIVWHHPDGRRAKLKVRDFPKGEQA